MPAPSAGGVVCVFAKRPMPGNVKTRLASAIGDARACALAEAFLADAIEARVRAGRPFALAVDEDDLAFAAAPRILLQGAGDLGARMTRVLEALLAEHAYAVLLGTDSPGLPEELVSRACDWLEDDGGPDAVVGPTTDGGFYLLGVRAPFAAALDGTRWSTEHACRDVEHRLQHAGLRIARLAEWFDVDVVSDLERLEALLASDRSLQAPATRRVLRVPPLVQEAP